MGCDIHMFIEKREDRDHEWRIDENHSRDEDELDEDGNVQYKGRLHQVSAVGRHYGIFGVLANVRTSGCLYTPRGVPDDASPDYKEVVQDWDSDGHTHHWLTLQEFKECLIKFDWSEEELDDPNLSIDAFYNRDLYWGEAYNKRPEQYSTIYRYCKKWIEDKLDSQKDIDPMFHLKPEVRLLFFFDN